MDTSLLFDRLAGCATRGEAVLLLRDADPAGLGAAFFQRVAELLGRSPGAAVALAAHWRAVRDRADDPAYAYRARGAAERIHGRWTSSAEAFRRAGETARNPVERLEFAIGAIDGLARAGQTSKAVALGKRLGRGLRRLGRPDLAARADLNTGNALLWEDRYRSAARMLESAARALRSPVEVASARLGLSTAHLYAGRPDLVREHAQAALTTFESMDLAAYADRCSINLAHEALHRGRADAALDLLLTVRSTTREDRFEGARVLELLGDVYQELNLMEEAADSYRAALTAGSALPPINRAHCTLGLGRVAMAAGDLRSAIPAFRTARRHYVRAQNEVWAAVAHLSLAEAMLAAGQRKAGHAAAAGAHAALARLAAKSWLGRAQIVLAETAGTPAEADAWAIRALRTLGRTGSPNLAWRALAVRARSARRTRLRHYRSMFQSMLEGRLRTTSTASRSAYLRDKGEAMREYLGVLLAHPTPARVREAIDVVTRSRAVALLDEIAASDVAPAIDPSVLDALRADLHQGTEEAPYGGGARRSTGARSLGSLQRRWVEATRAVRPGGALVARPLPGTVIYADLPNGTALLHGERGARLMLQRSELEAELRWLQFDLLAPMTDPEAPHEPLEQRLRTLACRLEVPRWAPADGYVDIAPDAMLWGVPWAALVRLDGDAEPVLLPNPALGAAAASSRLPVRPRAALWIFEAPDLPNVREEGRMFLDHFPDARVCRTLKDVRASLDEGPYDLLHVATHGRLCLSNPMFSLLSFVDGNLHAAEIARSGLQVGLATLSACESARMAVVHRDEPDGLARAFLARGARAILGSAWPLADAAALRTMLYYYSHLASGDTVWSSLAQARDACRAVWPHPYHWGAPILLGGYGKGDTRCETN